MRQIGTKDFDLTVGFDWKPPLIFENRALQGAERIQLATGVSQ